MRSVAARRAQFSSDFSGDADRVIDTGLSALAPAERQVTAKKAQGVVMMGDAPWVYATNTGLKAPIQTGEMSSAYIAEMCVNHFGAAFFRGSRVVCKYVASTFADEVITTHGVVREKLPKGQGFRFVVDVWAENEAGEKKTTGWVEVDVGV